MLPELPELPELPAVAGVVDRESGHRLGLRCASLIFGGPTGPLTALNIAVNGACDGYPAGSPQETHASFSVLPGAVLSSAVASSSKLR